MFLHIKQDVILPKVSTTPRHNNQQLLFNSDQGINIVGTFSKQQTLERFAFSSLYQLSRRVQSRWWRALYLPCLTE